jgi:photosystem II stability/assembly factor-like uncharacterized protein
MGQPVIVGSGGGPTGGGSGPVSHSFSVIDQIDMSVATGGPRGYAAVGPNDLIFHVATPTLAAGGTQFVTRWSADLGKTWTQEISQPQTGVASDLQVDAAGTLWLIASNVLYKSADRGVTWTPLPGITGFAPVLLTIRPGTGDLYLISTFMYRSTNGGTSWTQVDPGVSVQGVAFGKNGEIYEIGSINSTHGVIRKSTDGGATFTQVDPGLAPLPSSGSSGGGAWLAVDSAGTIYAICHQEGGGPANTNISQTLIRKSTDNGITWQVVNVQDFSNVTGTSTHYIIPGGIFVGAPGEVYAIVYNGADMHNLLLKSTDSGQSWSTLRDSANDPETTPAYPLYVRVAFAPKSGRYIFHRLAHIINTSTGPLSLVELY